jgi:antitoxin component YwqK of YwqJK toxin-antitoxin module
MKYILFILIIALRFSSLSQVITLEGETLNYYENGVIKEKGKTANGLKEGEWLSYYSTTQLKEKKKYVNDKLDGEYQEYYGNGNLKEKRYYLSGRVYFILF